MVEKSIEARCIRRLNTGWSNWISKLEPQVGDMERRRTSLETRRRGADEHLLCAVSVLVEDRRTGAMRAVLEGRARAEGPLGSVDRESVVRAAVHGALRPIATALGVPGHRG